MNKGTNYIVVTWGARQEDIKAESVEEITIYKHLRHISSLQHKHIKQITIGHPKSDKSSSLYSIYIENLRDVGEFNGISVKVVDTDNIGQSYGQLIECLRQYGKDFDYHIFIEDDFLPVIDHFDTRLIELIDSHGDCGYLCACIMPNDVEHGKHIGVSNGIFKTEYLGKLLSHISGGVENLFDPKKPGWKAQVEFSSHIFDCVDNIQDYTSEHRTLFIHNNHFNTYGDPFKPDIINPMEKVDGRVKKVVHRPKWLHRKAKKWSWQKKRIAIGTVIANSQEIWWPELHKKFVDMSTMWAYDHIGAYYGDTNENISKLFPYHGIKIDQQRLKDYNFNKAQAMHILGMHTIIERFLELQKQQEYDFLIIIDSDAFPIRIDWCDQIHRLLYDDANEMVTVLRPENLECRLHASIMAVKPDVDLLENFEFCLEAGLKDLMGAIEKDVIMPYYQEHRYYEIFKMIRSNAINTHPVYNAVYYDLFYHYGGGSRGPKHFLKLPPTLRGIKYYEKVFSKKIYHNILQYYAGVGNIFENPEQFIHRIAGGDHGLYATLD